MLCRGVIYRGVTYTRTFIKQICIVIFIKQNCIVNNHIKHKCLVASVFQRIIKTKHKCIVTISMFTFITKCT